MTKGIIFDYGGTIDTNGDHWGKVLWKGYERCGVPVTELQFREAYVYAERTLGSKSIIRPSYTFHKTLEIKLRLDIGMSRKKNIRISMLNCLNYYIVRCVMLLQKAGASWMF